MDGIGIANKRGQRTGNDGLIVRGLFLWWRLYCKRKGLCFRPGTLHQRADILRHFVACLGLASSLLLTGQPEAQSAGAPGTGAPENCMGIAADAARLSCYDAALGRVAVGATRPDRPRASQTPPPASGIAPPDAVEKFGDYGQLARDHQAKSEVPKRVTGQITKLSTLPNGLFRFTLDNQQTWQTMQADWAFDFKAGDRVLITRLPLGGYQVSVAGNNRSVSAKRTQ
jgi:hypothetical protein